MRMLLRGSALALLLGIGLAACNGADDNAAVPPAGEPAQTGSLPAEPAPLAPAPATPPAEEGAVQ
jgi:hypothetical protein